MKYILILSLLLTGCATNQYTVNGVEPGDNQTMKVIGGLLLMGVVAKGLANKNCNTPQTIRNSNGQIIGTVGNC